MRSETKILNITPDVTLFPKLGRVRFTVTTALPELIDNAIDNRPEDATITVNIRLDRTAGLIEVADNSGGLTLDELQKALTIGYSVSNDPNRIGENGFGLKAAATFMASTFHILTRKKGSDETLEVEYNEADFVQAGEWRLPCNVFHGLMRPEHGTTITLRNLKVDLAAIKDEDVIKHLSMIYRTYLQQGILVINVNSKPVEPVLIERLGPPAPFKEINITVAGGKRVYGWVGARSPEGVPGDDKGGFELFRRGRMIIRDWVGVRWTARRRYMIGEFHLDEFEVNNNKTDFIRDTEEWIEFEQALALELKGFDVYSAVTGKKSRKKNPVSSNGDKGSKIQSTVAGATQSQTSVPDKKVATKPDVQAEGKGNSVEGVTVPVPKLKPPRKDSLALKDLHPRIRTTCEHLFRSGDFGVAVQQAFSQVNKYVRERTGIKDDKGKDLMWHVFTPKSARVDWVKAQLHFSDLVTDSDKNEQEGFMHIFAGAQQGIRNPSVHTGIELTEDEALEYLAFASLLCRKIDQAKVVSQTKGSES